MDYRKCWRHAKTRRSFANQNTRCSKRRPNKESCETILDKAMDTHFSLPTVTKLETTENWIDRNGLRLKLSNRHAWNGLRVYNSKLKTTVRPFQCVFVRLAGHNWTNLNSHILLKYRVDNCLMFKSFRRRDYAGEIWKRSFISTVWPYHPH